MRESWTDERLDHLNARVDEGFKQMDKRLDKLERRFDKLEDRFASLQLTLLVVGGGLMGTVIACSAGLVATQI